MPYKIVTTVLLFFSLVVNVAFAGDQASPVSVSAFHPPSPDGGFGWYWQSVSADIFSWDLESGVKSISYKINNNPPTTATFENTINLIENPSFEDSLSESWSLTPGTTGGVDSSSFYHGFKSVYIDSAQLIQGCWSNYIRYIPASSADKFYISGFTKGDKISGKGLYFSLYALTPNGSQFLAETQALQGSFSWSMSSKNISALPENTIGVYVELCLSGSGRGYFDGIFVGKTQMQSVLSIPIYQNGENRLEYFAKDATGNIEPTSTRLIKIDSRSPTGWSNFVSTRQGNEHTFMSAIDVFDRESGLKGDSAKFQYSLDAGVSWGYYSNYGACKGNFIKGGWIDINERYSNGDAFGRLETPAINYCNSNWKTCKTLRFSVSDISGRESTKDICLNGPWFSTAKADIFAKGKISQNGSPGGYTGSFFIFGGGDISNVTSNISAIFPYFDSSLNIGSFEDMLFLQKDIVQTSAFPSSSGVWLYSGNLSISSNTIPTSVKNATALPVLFVDGDLTINSAILINEGGGVIFIVSGDIEIDRNVSEVDAGFISFGSFDSAYNGGANSSLLLVRGFTISNSVILSRITEKNSNYQGEKFVYDGTYLLKFPTFFGGAKVIYKEI
jgi:hypothetical protein